MHVTIYLKQVKKVANIALKNIQPPVIAQPDIAQPQNPISQQSGQPVTLQQPTAVGKDDYADFMKGLKALNNELDDLLTQLDATFEDVEYPRINLQHKQKHNRNYERFYQGRNRHNRQVGRGLSKKMKGGAFPFWTLEELDDMTDQELADICDQFLIRKPRSKQGKIQSILLFQQHYQQNNNNDNNLPGMEEDENEMEEDSLSSADNENDSAPTFDSFDLSTASSPLTEPDYDLPEDEIHENQIAPEPDDDDDDDGVAFDRLESLMTADLKVIANQISNLQIKFSAYISATFNTLQQPKVTAIEDEIKLIRSKIHELITDEFAETYHKPQTEWIKTNFDKLYSSIMIKVNGYVKPRINGGSIDTTSIYNFRHYM